PSLRPPRHASAPAREAFLVELPPVHEQAAALRQREAEQEGRERALAGAARPHERDRLVGPELEVDALEHGCSPGGIREGDVLEPDEADAMGYGQAHDGALESG